MSAKLNTEIFIERSKKIHGDRYDYSKSIYTTSASKIKIICKIHGEYLQIAWHHRKHGCNDCGNDRLRHGNKDFIEKSKKVHGDLYDYSLVDYKGRNSKLIVICALHGKFLTSVASHCDRKFGCPDCCVNKSCVETIKTEDFIIKANKIH